MLTPSLMLKLRIGPHNLHVVRKYHPSHARVFFLKKNDDFLSLLVSFAFFRNQSS